MPISKITGPDQRIVLRFAHRAYTLRRRSFDAIFEAQGARMIRTPGQVPEAIGDQVKLPDKEVFLV